MPLSTDVKIKIPVTLAGQRLAMTADVGKDAFELELSAGFSLSGLPLIGRSLGDDQTVSMKNLCLLYDSGHKGLNVSGSLNLAGIAQPFPFR